jgi:hypothetical protein
VISNRRLILGSEGAIGDPPRSEVAVKIADNVAATRPVARRSREGWFIVEAAGRLRWQKRASKAEIVTFS